MPLSKKDCHICCIKLQKAKASTRDPNQSSYINISQFSLYEQYNVLNFNKTMGEKYNNKENPGEIQRKCDTFQQIPLALLIFQLLLSCYDHLQNDIELSIDLVFLKINTVNEKLPEQSVDSLWPVLQIFCTAYERLPNQLRIDRGFTITFKRWE